MHEVGLAHEDPRDGEHDAGLDLALLEKAIPGHDARRGLPARDDEIDRLLGEEGGAVDPEGEDDAEDVARPARRGRDEGAQGLQEIGLPQGREIDRLERAGEDVSHGSGPGCRR